MNRRPDCFSRRTSFSRRNDAWSRSELGNLRYDSVANAEQPIGAESCGYQFRRVAMIFVMLALILGGAGCGSMRRPGFPKQSLDGKKLIGNLENTFDLARKIEDYYKKSEEFTRNGTQVLSAAQKEALRVRRNEIISSRLALINLHYNQFISDASFNNQVFSLSTDLLDLGVDLATTVVGGAGTKTILGAVSAGISGAQASIHKHLFFEKTVSALVATMNAARKEALIPVAQGLKQDLDAYPLAQALSDLDSYYFAGTFLGALQSIQKTAGENEGKAEEELAKIREVNFVSDVSGESIRNFIRPVNGVNEAKLLEWIDRSSLKGTSIDTLINSNGETFVAARKEVVTALSVPVPAGMDALPEDQRCQVALQAFWRPRDVAAEKRLKDWLALRGLTEVPIETFISGDEFAKARAALVKELNIPLKRQP